MPIPDSEARGHVAGKLVHPSGRGTQFGQALFQEPSAIHVLVDVPEYPGSHVYV